MRSCLEVLQTVSDLKSLSILNSIARRPEAGTGELISGTKVSRKECYSRISRFVKAGMLRRSQGRYLLTPFGKIIYEILLTLVEEINLKSESIQPTLATTPELSLILES